jgi:CoA:oxalate CoA-transferase
MIQKVKMGDGFTYETTRCPITIEGKTFVSEKGSPKVSEHTDSILKEFNAS